MGNSRLSAVKLRELYRLFCLPDLNISRCAIRLHVERNTLKKYLNLWKAHQMVDVRTWVALCKAPPEFSAKASVVNLLWPSLTSAAKPNNIRQMWTSYRREYPKGFGYSQFAHHYAQWRKRHEECSCTKAELSIPPADLQQLQQWRQSNDRRRWERAVVLLETVKGVAVAMLAVKIERSKECIRGWLHNYRVDGLDGLVPRKRAIKEEVTNNIALKKENVVKLIHEAPQLHGFNRTSWRLKDLAAAYHRMYGSTISMAMISVYIRQEGYVFRKARKVLTSPDPAFREKLTRIQAILGALTPKEKFFSIDEYGPFSVKQKGGRSLVKQGEFKTFPQHQKSKGFLICTAALELSGNQVTHFYSRKKDTEEMIKLIGLLCQRYHGSDKLYLSWDAAIWHASKKLLAFIEKLNSAEYRSLHHNPLIELAPLPASAQFLNVIESVFSGLAKAVIHHSDYPSVGHCQAAIDTYFKHRNEHFARNPKKAGKKIWGQERTVAEFRDCHNCKDPAWR